MKLASAPTKYDRDDQAQMRGAIERADADNVKRAAAVTYLLMSKPDGAVGKLTINSSGAPVWTAL